MFCHGWTVTSCIVARIVWQCETGLTRPSRLPTVVISCNHYRLCVLIHLILHSAARRLLVSVSHFSLCSFSCNYRPPTSLHSLASENRRVALFFSFCFIHLPDLQLTPRSDPVTLLTLFSLLLLLNLLSHIAHSSLSTSLAGKSCDFSEAEPYKPAVLGGLSVYTALWLALAFTRCSHTHTHCRPPVYLFQEQMWSFTLRSGGAAVHLCLCVCNGPFWFLVFNEWELLTRWN